MNLDQVVKTARLAGALFSEEYREKVGSAGSAVADFAVAEVQYTSAVAKLSAQKIAILAGVALAALALVIAFVTVASVATLLILPELFPATFSVLGAFGVVALLHLLCIAVIAWVAVRHGQELALCLRDYADHWNAATKEAHFEQ